MATKTYYFHGTGEWLKYDEKFGRWVVNVILDNDSWKKFRDSGAQLKVRSKKDAPDVNYVTFARRKTKLVKGEVVEAKQPDIMDTDGNPIDIRKVGNGSKITCKVNVFDTIKGKGSDLLAIRVDELVEYKPVEVDETEESPF